MDNNEVDQLEEKLDARVQNVLDKARVSTTDESEKEPLSEDEMFEDLENDDLAMANFREQRLNQLKTEMGKLQEMQQHDHGTLTEISSEKEVLNITTSTKHCVVHFFHKEFRRCQIMDKHLTTIARKHFKTKFVKINVENAPFLVERLGIQILPCVICFVDGISTDKIIGFDELGNTDSFSTTLLELRLSTSGVITKSDEPKKEEQRKTIFGYSDKQHEDDDDWD
ncbi:hypothetical protein G9A89_005414 [Geosiphon pyriformis]|nr:hypothetical protein G9A89_005414 [Geosiphon pyriformis]